MLMTLEVALALVLVSGSGLLAMSLVRLYCSGAGLDPKGLVNITFSDKQQLEGDPLMQTYQQLGEGLSHLPGMRNVSLQFIVPLSGRGWNGSYSADRDCRMRSRTGCGRPCVARAGELSL